MNNKQSPVKSHPSSFLEDRLKVAPWFNYLCYALVVIGVITFAAGFFLHPDRTWANYLLNNFYFLGLAIGASFFMALQYITQSGWSSGFKRVPEAIGSYIPVAALFFLVLYFGIHAIYDWSDPEMAKTDEIIRPKVPFLNVPFFMIRIVIYFGCWTLMTRILRKYSVREDLEGGMKWFYKSELYSRIYIFLLAITFSLASFDILMSVEADWSSMIYGFKSFASAFYHASAVILLITVILHKMGYFPFFTRNHLQDMSSYVFMLSIIYGYLWFSQFMLIWYGNIPEETIYYAVRWQPRWHALFYADIVINWLIPFVILMPKTPSRRLKVVIPIVILLMVGYWIELYLQIMPGVTGNSNFGFIEIGTFLGYAGLFALVIARTLSSALLVPKNHPYLVESLDHHVA
jgi:hypothetical protein